MFTESQKITKELKKLGMNPENLTFIPRGVMTDKYSFDHDGKTFIVRCFQSYRAHQPEIEFRYLSLFKERDIKAPEPVLYSSDSSLPFLIYDMLEGVTLAECFDSLSPDTQNSLCNQIADNYTRISEIQNHGYGRIQAFDKFSDSSWQEFIQSVIVNAETMSENNGLIPMKRCCKRMRQFALSIPEPTPNLIWSDFSSDNIIVDENGDLSGFIDFEGFLSGDSTLGIGYLAAHESNRNLVDRLKEVLKIQQKSELVDFYSLIRWCRLMPYQHLPLLNGEKREPLQVFLPYAYSLIEAFGR